MKAVERRACLLDCLGQILLLGRPLLPWQWRGTLIWVPFDLHAFVHGTRHHASPCEETVMDGIQRQIRIAVLVKDTDDDQIVDMI